MYSLYLSILLYTCIFFFFIYIILYTINLFTNVWIFITLYAIVLLFIVILPLQSLCTIIYRIKSQNFCFRCIVSVKEIANIDSMEKIIARGEVVSRTLKNLREMRLILILSRNKLINWSLYNPCLPKGFPCLKTPWRMRPGNRKRIHK